ncbi:MULTISPECIES: STAS/SEC14 domain-containing protein [unclassified Pseudarthrobacter]|uniref:DUF7793 family protein n=1 Tax=unclassified Pseudarthrobacter TaxID=2647000 RepID=UPI00363360B7
MDEEQTTQPLFIAGGKGTVAMGADGIIHLVWNPEARIGVEDAQAAMAAVNTVADNREYPMLVDMATTQEVTRPARSVFSIPCAANKIALLGSSPVDRVIANFFLSVHVPPCPTRFFTSKDESKAWLLNES